MATTHGSGTGKLRQYRKKAGNEVVAVRLDLDTDGFTYEKWGGTQQCKAGDWIVDNKGDTYTVDADTFADTYREVRPGVYLKAAAIWATKASQAGSILTKEGSTRYEAGDYVVYNDKDGQDGYAISKDKFDELYELLD